jgi:hypothetical protein
MASWTNWGHEDFGNVKNHQVNSNALVGNSFEGSSAIRFVLQYKKHN